MLPSFLSTHQQKPFSRNLSGFSSKSPLQPSSLSLPFTQASFGFHKYFGEMRRALNLESGHLVLDQLPQTHQTNDWTSPSHVFSPLSNEDDDTYPIFLKALLWYSENRAEAPSNACYVAYREKGIGLEKHSKTVLFLKPHCQKQELQRRFRGMHCVSTFFPSMNFLPACRKTWLSSFITSVCRAFMCMNEWTTQFCQSFHLPFSFWK